MTGSACIVTVSGGIDDRLTVLTMNIFLPILPLKIVKTGTFGKHAHAQNAWLLLQSTCFSTDLHERDSKLLQVTYWHIWALIIACAVVATHNIISLTALHKMPAPVCKAPMHAYVHMHS